MENVYSRGKSWLTNVQVRGRRIRHSYRTKTEAQRAARDLKQLGDHYKRGNLPQDISLAFFKKRFEEFIQSKNPQTQYRDKYAFRLLESQYSIRWLRDITPERLDGFKGKLLKAEYGRPGINRALKSIKAAMRKAQSWKLIAPQDWASVKQLETPKARMLFYALDELGRLQAKCHGKWLTGFMLGYEAGLRPMEKLKLEVRDIHWNIHKLQIWNSKGTKSRWVPMTERLEVHLQSIQMGQTFVLGDDKPNEDVWSTYWRKLIKNAKLKGSEYTLRHTFASHYIMSGGQVEKLQKIMGHSSITMTMIYVHLSQASLDEHIQKLPAPVRTSCTPLRVA